MQQVKQTLWSTHFNKGIPLTDYIIGLDKRVTQVGCVNVSRLGIQTQDTKTQRVPFQVVKTDQTGMASKCEMHPCYITMLFEDPTGLLSTTIPLWQERISGLQWQAVSLNTDPAGVTHQGPSYKSTRGGGGGQKNR